MQKRMYGNSGEMLSIIGFGGIVVTDEEQRDANNYVAEALDRGVNYFDVAPSYGNAEEKLGPALVGKRNSIFLACKTEKRTAKDAEASLHNSLKLLKTDRFDLYQLHGVTTEKEVDTIFAPGGAMETLLKAKEKGLVRYLGFSAHSDEAALALFNGFEFNSALFPVNWACFLSNGFGTKIMKKAEEKGAARLALKAMAHTGLAEGEDRPFERLWYRPIEDKEHAMLALRYTLSQPVTAAIPPGDVRLFRWALEAAEDFKPVSVQETELLKERSGKTVPLFPQK